MAYIKKPVGSGGMNQPDDLAAVQYLLNCVPAHLGGPSKELKVDGKRESLNFFDTVAAIRKFQVRIFNGWSDGLVEPHGQTILHLGLYDPARGNAGLGEHKHREGKLQPGDGKHAGSPGGWAADPKWKMPGVGDPHHKWEQGHKGYFPAGHKDSFPAGHKDSFPAGHKGYFPAVHKEGFPAGHKDSFPAGHKDAGPLKSGFKH